MNSGEGPSFGLALPHPHQPHHGVKRTHDQISQARPRQVSPSALMERSPSPLFVHRDVTPTREASPRRQRLLLPPLVPAIRDNNEARPFHERRPGFDYRRPAATTMRPRRGSGSIIDLTEEEEDDATNTAVPQHQAEPSIRRQRLPNFGREIIDLSADASPAGAEEGGRAHTGPRLHRESSSDVVFVSEQPRSNSPQSAAGTRRGQQPIFADLTEDDDDDVVVVRTASRAGRPGAANLPPPIARGNVRAANDLAQILARERAHTHTHAGNRLLRRLEQAWGAGGGDELEPFFFEDFLDDGFDVQGGPAHFRRQPAARPFLPPGNMMYDRIGFAMGGERTRDPTPEYQAPPALPEGFTGDPREDEPVVCPACGDELAVGDSEEKRQVWVVKSCGHVYCGFCIKNRGKKSKVSSKGKGRADLPTPKHFSQCLVDGCTSKVSTKTSVQQIFL